MHEWVVELNSTELNKHDWMTWHDMTWIEVTWPESTERNDMTWNWRTSAWANAMNIINWAELNCFDVRWIKLSRVQLYWTDFELSWHEWLNEWLYDWINEWMNDRVSEWINAVQMHECNAMQCNAPTATQRKENLVRSLPLCLTSYNMLHQPCRNHPTAICQHCTHLLCNHSTAATLPHKTHWPGDIHFI